MFAALFATALSGHSGLLTVPDASVLDEGRVAAGTAFYDPRPGISDAQTWHFGAGLLPRLELSGRVVEADQVRDLSFSGKLQLWRSDGGLGLAVGAQDLGGEARYLRAKYAVASFPLDYSGPWPGSVSLTAGHGWGPDLLEGTLAGVDWKPVSWLSVLGEYDGQLWSPAARVSAGAFSTTLGYRDGEWVSGLAFSLDLVPAAAAHPVPQPEARVEVPKPPVAARAKTAGRSRPPAPPDLLSKGRVIRSSLEAEGFEVVRTGQRADGTLTVQFENRIYNHSAADGIAAATKVIRAHAPDAPLDLTVTAYGVPQYTSTGHDAGSIQWHNAPAPLTAIELVLEPVLRTLVATEYGVLDYGLAVRGRLTAPLGHGLLTNLALTSPAAHSDDVDTGGVYSAFEPRAGLDLATLQYFHKPHPQWGWLWTAGHSTVLQSTFKVAGFEQLWTTPNVRHQVRARALTLHGEDRAAHVAVAGYVYYDPVRHWTAGLSGGRYFRNEGGLRLDFARWFGDVRIGLFVRGAGREEQLGGIEISLPLTPRKDMAPSGWLQLKGPRQWRHGLASTLNAADGRNPIRPLLAYEPELDLDLRRDFYDSGRMGAY